MKSPVKIKSQGLLFLGWIVIVSPAFAGLFTNEELPKKIQQLEAKVLKLEVANKKLEEANRKLEEVNKQQARAMLDLQSQIEAQIADTRVLRGHNEEFAHDLQEAKQRQKDFYVDLDARLRTFETTAAIEVPAKKEAQAQKDALNAENRAYEEARSLLATNNHTGAISALQEFIKQYPQSVHVLNAHYDLGEAYFQAEDYKKSLVSYRHVASSSSQTPRVIDAMFRIADCQIELKDRDAAKGTLKKIISNYPGTVAAEKARKRLASLK